MITLGRLHEMKLYRLIDNIIDKIMSSTNSQWSNKKLLNLIIFITKNDYQLLGLSFILERLAIGDVLMTDCPHIESFRNGRCEDNQYITQLCMYTSWLNNLLCRAMYIHIYYIVYQNFSNQIIATYVYTRLHMCVQKASYIIQVTVEPL